jgi:protein SCO1/2
MNHLSGAWPVRYALHLVTVLLVVGLLASCQQKAKPFNAVDITGAAGYGTDILLTDHTGTKRSLADFRGKAVAVFFGFTFCPDVCPTTLSDMKQVMKLLDKDAQKLQVLFVTVDPKRDTAEVLSRYVPSFHPSFLGLYGDEAATAKVIRDFRIVARTVPGSSPDTYTIDHTAGTLIFDAQGRLRLMAPYGLAADKVAEDVKRLF